MIGNRYYLKGDNIDFVSGFFIGLIFNIYGIHVASDISEKAKKGAIVGLLAPISLVTLFVLITRISDLIDYFS